jgi:hypothetical protein
MPSRRRVLTVVGAGFGTGLSGCSGMLGATRPAIDLIVANYRETPVGLTIAFLEPRDRDGEPIHQERLEIPVMSGEEDLWREDDHPPSLNYRVEGTLGNTGGGDAYRYAGACPAAEGEDIRV